MSITTAASGIRVITPAKTTILDGSRTAGSASQLGSQSGANADQVIVPNAIGTNNEGNLEASPSYVGRHFVLRPLATLAEGGGIAAAAAIAAGGSGYTNGAQTLTVSGGTFPSGNAATVDVNVVGGVVTTITGINYHGNYTVTPTNAVATTGGGGTGCTLNMTWVDGEEIRFITADASNTLDVHEDWTNPPVSGEDWAISYIPEDCATLTGCTKSAKTGVFEFSRRLYVGDDAATAFAFYGMAEGKAMEIDDVGGGVAGLVLTDGGIMVVGYASDGVSINGGFFIGINNSAAENVMQFDDGGRCYFHDSVAMSYLQNLNVSTTPGATAVVEMRSSKFFQTNDDFDIGGWLIRDSAISAGAAGTNLLVIDEDTDIDGLVLINTQGFDAADDATTREFSLKAVTFAGNSRHVLVHDDHVWRFVDPVGWIGDSTYISFEVDDLNRVDQLFTLGLLVVDLSGNPIANAQVYVYEDDVNAEFPGENQKTTTALGVGSSEVLKNRYTYPASVFTTTAYGGFAIRVFRYGYAPFATPLTLNNPFDIAVTLVIDDSQTQGPGEGYAAIKLPSNSPSIERHGTGETDTRPLKVLNFDAGNSNPPTVTGTLTGGTSGATGTIIEVLTSDNVTGTLVVELWNGTEYLDNEPLDDGGLFSADAHLSGAGSFYEEYTWEVDADTEGMANLYDWAQGNAAQGLSPLVFLDDGGALTEYTDEAKTPDLLDDVLLMPATPATGDASMFGDWNALPTEISIELSTSMTTSTLVWEYWNGSTWAALSGVTDGTTNYTAAAGTRIVTYTYPTDAARFFGVAYFVRARQSHATPVGTARADEVHQDLNWRKKALWGQGEQSSLFYKTATGWKTERNVATTEGVWLKSRGSGLIDYMTADDGTQYVPEVLTAVTIAGLKDNTEVRVFLAGTTTEVAGIENATAGSPDDRSFTFTQPATTSLDYRLLNKAGYINKEVRSYTVPSADVTINEVQAIDRNYNNP